MFLNQNKVKMLLDALVLTNESEVDCDQCFDSMSEFAESQLSGASVPEALSLIDNHIRICPDCREEFQILKKAIADLDKDYNDQTPDRQHKH